MYLTCVVESSVYMSQTERQHSVSALNIHRPYICMIQAWCDCQLWHKYALEIKLFTRPADFIPLLSVASR